MKSSFGPQPPVAKLCAVIMAKALRSRLKMFLAAQCQIGLHRRADGIDRAAGMLARQHVFACGQMIEKIFVDKQPQR
jgi:hypothetical protein